GPLSRCARVRCLDVRGTDCPDREKRGSRARPNVLDPDPTQFLARQCGARARTPARRPLTGRPIAETTVERRDHCARAVVSTLHRGFGRRWGMGPVASWTERG